MALLNYQTAGESHGPSLVVMLTGVPAGLVLDVDFINAELSRRQGGYGRGGRQRIEQDRVEFLTGVRRGRAIGAPLTIRIVNNDSRLDDLQTFARKTPVVGDDFTGLIKSQISSWTAVAKRAKVEVIA